MSEDWSRPTNIPFPNKWSEFEGKNIKNGSRRKYWIEDITPDTIEECLNVMFPAFVFEEPLAKHSSK